MYNMALMLEGGEGCEQSYATAADWYRRAALQGSVDAKVNLGILLTTGTGLKFQDHEQANVLYQEAIEGGSIRYLLCGRWVSVISKATA